jgi:hypothetical protein
MNEQIQKVKFECLEWNAWAYAWEINPDKFAELIIVKCANVVWDEAEKTDNHQVNDAGYKILEHFGIEE